MGWLREVEKSTFPKFLLLPPLRSAHLYLSTRSGRRDGEPALRLGAKTEGSTRHSEVLVWFSHTHTQLPVHFIERGEIHEDLAETLDIEQAPHEHVEFGHLLAVNDDEGSLLRGFIS